MPSRVLMVVFFYLFRQVPVAKEPAETPKRDVRRCYQLL